MLDKIQEALPAALRPYAKAVTPATLVVVGVLVRWAVTGTWDDAQWGAAITGLLAVSITYWVPNADPAAILTHPAAAALEFLGDRPVPDVLQLLPDEDSTSVARALSTSADIADQLGVLKPQATPFTGQRASVPRLEASHTTVSGLVARRAHSASFLTNHYLVVASRMGCRKGLAKVIISKCRARGIPISLGFALIHHESGFRKVFGHDPTIYVGAGFVTRAKYLAYKARRRASGNRLMQGVGEGQLTWWSTQDAADGRGGCWRADANVDTAFITLAANVHHFGYALGIERYNGSGPAAVAYSRNVRAETARWHHELTKGLT